MNSNLDNEKFQIVQFSEKLHSHILTELTAILHEAYAPLATQGLHYLASWQPVEKTLKRLLEGESWLFYLDDQLIGAVSLYEGIHKTHSSEYYRNPGVFLFGQFAIKLQYQGLGFGSKVMNFLEARAVELGAKELALDTSEQATALIKMYLNRGYRIVSEHQWPEVNYKSLILSKVLAPQRQ